MARRLVTADHKTGAVSMPALEERLATQDTGWVDVALPAGVTATAGHGYKVRRIGNLVHHSLFLTEAEESTHGGYFNALLPVGFRPSLGFNFFPVRRQANGSGTRTFDMWGIEPNGNSGPDAGGKGVTLGSGVTVTDEPFPS